MERLVQAKPILLQVILESDLKTLLSLRLTSKAIYDLITAYETSISKCVAGRTFSNPILLLRPNNHPEPSIKWLLQLQHRTLVAPRLSTLAVDHQRYYWRFSGQAMSIPAFDPRGDELRMRVDSGLYILWHLSDIAVVTQALDRTIEPSRYLGLGPRQNRLVRKQEAEVHSKRLALLAQLDPSQAQDFEIMHSFMGAAFDNSNLCDLNPLDWGLFNGGLSWLYWYTLRIGPRLFVQAWESESSREMVVQNIKDEWKIRSKKRADIERSYAHRFHLRIQRKVYANGLSGVTWAGDFITDYWEKRRLAGDIDVHQLSDTAGVRLSIC
ncbi:MAG: hypothetical protein M1835_007277 [Candelina submexicana]|nr:MAG: hypothetical protein M1835_007277 [Candelina submexicana]